MNINPNYSPIPSPEEINRSSLLNQPSKTADSNANIHLSDAQSKPPSLDLEKLAMDGGDPFIRDTTFEGSSYSDTIPRLINALQTLPSSYNPETKENILSLLSKSKSIAEVNKKIYTQLINANAKLNEFLSAKNQNLVGSPEIEENLQNIEKLASTISSEVNALSNNEKLIVPTGWSSLGKTKGFSTGGHAILMTFERQENNNFKLTVFNTGAGLESKHPCYIDKKGNVRYQTFLQIKNISPAKINPLFFQTILEGESVPLWDINETIQPSRFYDMFLGSLDGEPVPALDPILYNAFYMKPQRAGTCASKSLFAALRYFTMEKGLQDPELLPELLNDYKKFRFAYKQQSLIEACQVFFQHDQEWDRSAHKLISEISRSLAKSAIKLSKKHLISEEDLRICLATIEDIHQKLANKKREAKAAQNAEPYIIPLKSNNNALASNLEYSNIPVKKIEKNAVKVSFTAPIGVPSNPKEWTVETVVDYLNSWSVLNKEKEQSPALYDAAAEALRNLPFLKAGKLDEIWKKIPQEQIETCLAGLFNLSSVFMGPVNLSVDKTDQSQKDNVMFNSPGAVLGTFTALAIAEALANRQPENKLEGFLINHSGLIKFAYFDSTVLSNPKDQVRLNELLKHFDKTLDPRFGIPNAIYLQNSDFLFGIQIKNRYVESSYTKDILSKEFREKCHENDMECKYYYQFLKNANVQKTLKEANLLSSGPEDQIVYLITQAHLGNPVIPKSVLYLKNIAIIAQLIDSSNCSKNEFVYSPYRNFEFRFKRGDLLRGKEDDEKTRLIDWKYHLSYQTLGSSDDDGLKKIENESVNSDAYKFSRYGVNNRSDTTQNTIICNNSKEAERDALTVCVNAHDEVIRVLDYLENYPKELESSGSRSELMKNLMWPERIWPQITQEPRSCIKIMSSLNRLLEDSLKNKKLGVLITLLTICNQYENYIRYAQSIDPKKFTDLPHDFPRNYRKWTLDTALNLFDNESIRKSLILTALGFSLSKQSQEPSTQHLEDVAEDWLTVSLMGNVEEDKDCLVDLVNPKKENSLTLATTLPVILQKLENEPEVRDRLLNQVVERLSGTVSTSKWSGKYPLYKTDKLQADFEEGILIGAGTLATIIPKAIRKNENFQMLFKKLDKYECLSPTHYIIYDKNGLTKIEIKQDEIEISRTINGINYTFLPVKSVNIFTGSSWYYNPAELKNPGFIPFSNSAIFWKSKDGSHCLVQTPEGKDFHINTGELEYKQYGDNKTKIDVIKDAKDPSRILIDPSSSPEYAPFSEFTKEIYIWSKREADKKELDLVEIQMPKLNLNFFVAKDPKGISRLYSQEENGYFVSSNQMPRMRGIWPPFIVLENDRKQLKVITRTINININDNYYPQEKENFDPEISNIKNDFTITCQIEEVQGKVHLKANTQYESLTLLGQFLWTKRFKQALSTLSQCRALRPYTIDERCAIIGILEQKYGGSHPSAILCRLNLAVMLIENSLKYGNENLSISSLSEDYDNYIQNLNNTTEGSLTVEEEKTILRFIGKGTTYPMAKRLDNILNTNKAENSDLFIAPKTESTNYFEYLNVQSLPYSAANYILDNLRYNQTEKTMKKSILSLKTFKENFAMYYNVAQSGKDEERKELVQFIKQFLAQFSKNDALAVDVYACAHALLVIAENPEIFPSSKEIKNIDYSELSNTKEKLAACLKGKIPLPQKPFLIFPYIDSDSYGFENKSVRNALELFEDIPKYQPNKTNRNIELSSDLDLIDQTWNEKLSSAKNAAKTDLENWSAQETKKQEEEEKALLDLANGISPEATTLEALQRLGRTKRQLTMSDLVSLFEEGNVNRYADMSYLSEKQIADLDKKIGEFFINSVRRSQLLRIISLMNECENTPDNEEKELLTAQISNEFKNSRQYKLAGDLGDLKRKLLIMEHRSQILLRDKQVKTMINIHEQASIKELLLELGTGSGKSKVLAPLMERLKQTGKAVFNVWPGSLFATNRDDMSTLVSQTFGQKATTFEFTRSSSTEPMNLIRILRELSTAIIEKSQINTTPESLQCFELKFLELLHNGTDGERYEECVTLMQGILQLIHEGEFHIDEAHINLSPKREVNFTIGTPSRESMERIEFIGKIFDFLTEGEVGKTLGISEDKQRFASPEQFDDIAHKMSEHFIAQLNISQEQKESYQIYVMGGEAPTWLFEHPQIDLIVLLREHLTTLLPSILQKSVNVNFGLSHKINESERSREQERWKPASERKDIVKYAIPYHGNDTPIENARYENIFETLNKTYLTYLYNGLSVDNLFEIIENLQTKALQEAKDARTDTHNTLAYKEYQKIFQDAFPDLFAIDRKILESKHHSTKKLRNVILYYVTNFVAPTVTKYSEKLRSTPQDILNMSKINLAMTATPGDPETYRSSIGFTPDKGSEELVINKILSSNNPIHVVNDASPDELLAQAISMLKDNFRMLIDVGALFKGTSNKKIAEKLLKSFENNPHIKGVVFFDDNNKMMILEKGRKLPIPADYSNLSPKERFTYCDQQHAFGTDTKQFAKAKGLATFDTLTVKNEVVQGVGRLRQFLHGQSIEWMLTNKTEEKIQHNGPLKIRDLFNHSVLNEQTLQQENTRRSLRQQMYGELRSALMKELRQRPAKEAKELFKQFSFILVESVPASLILPSKKSNMDKSPIVDPLMQDYETLVKITNELRNLSKTDREEILIKLDLFKQKIMIQAEEITKRSKGLQKQADLNAIKLGTEVESEVEIQNENKKNVLAEFEQQNEYENSSYRYNSRNKREPMEWPTNFSFFNNNWIEPHNISSNYKQEADKEETSVLLHDIMAVIESSNDTKISEVKSLFTPSPSGKVLMTNNFIMMKPESTYEKGVVPLSDEQKSVYEVLIVQDVIEGKKSWRVIVGDQSTDAYFWREELNKLSPEKTKDQSRRICLYDLNLGIVKDSPNRFEENELDNDPDLQALLVKVKLFNADIRWTKMQKKMLEQMANTPEAVKTLYNFFLKALDVHQEKKKLFKGSWIESFLKGENK